MKWLLLGLLALGCALIVLGYASTRSGASADERAGGALPILLGCGVIIVALVIAFVWLVIRA